MTFSRRCNETVEQIVDVLLMPEVPGIGRSPGSDDNTFLGLIQTNLILPLAIIYTRWCSPTPMH